MTSKFAIVNLHRGIFAVLTLLAVLLALLSNGCGRSSRASSQLPSQIAVAMSPSGAITFDTGAARFEVLPSGYVRAALKDQSFLTLDEPEGEQVSASDFVAVNSREVRDFSFDLRNSKFSDASSVFGARGKRIEVTGRNAETGLAKILTVEVYDDFPSMAFTTTSYRNIGNTNILIERGVSQRHRLSASAADAKLRPFEMWSFSGASEAWGKDEVTPVSEKFARPNVMQTVMKNDTNMTGGGVPVVAFWTGSVGEAIGVAETLPLPVSMQTRTARDGRVEASIAMDGPGNLPPGGAFSMPTTFVAVYHGDYYEPLRLYASSLRRKGWATANPNSADYEANWCGWGYLMDFTPKQMLETIPKLKELGIKWATLDAGWFANRGDWEPRTDTFPGDSVKRVVSEFHKQGIRMTIWWIPIIAEDGAGNDILNNKPYRVSNVVKEHPDWLILDKDGKRARATANTAALCPAVPEVQQYFKRMTEKFIRDWDYDGHKLDFSYAIPACYNPKHHHKSPADSTNAMGEIYKIIFETTRALKPESVTQACPCGTPPNFAWLPYIDQAVTADPVGARQARMRTKAYKALLGPSAAIYGDHVELSEVGVGKNGPEYDLGRDFASTVGTGAVLGTKFTWPDYGTKFKKLTLTPEKQTHWKKWIEIYNAKMLSRGTFRNLYVYGYDSPEAYAIEKDGKIYYAFFAPTPHKQWKGTLQLRGLTPGRYRVFDYANGRELGAVDAADPRLPNAEFTDNLLIEVSKI